MNLVFAGTPAFAVPSLRALLDAGHRVAAVYTQPDRPAGRGRRLTPSPVKQLAQAHGLPVFQPLSLKGGADALRALQPDVMIVAAYGLLLPPAVLAVPRYGCINVHASLLPRWRGAAPIARAIEAGDAVTGITIMQMAQGLDTGAMLHQVTTPIASDDSTAVLQERLAVLGATALIDTLDQLRRGALTPRAQEESQACYASKLTKDEAWLDWRQPAAVLARKVRALNPWPVAQTRQAGAVLRIWAAQAEDAAAGAAPGTVLTAAAGGIGVATGQGVLRLLRLQAQGGKVLTPAAFLSGRRLGPGDRFEGGADEAS